jgi:hypothetical protein
MMHGPVLALSTLTGCWVSTIMRGKWSRLGDDLVMGQEQLQV